MSETESSGTSTAESLREYGRGLAGGLLFSLPLLYTMEVWWTGFIAEPERLLAYLAGVFLLLLGYNRFSGMHPGVSVAEVLIDSVEELGLGIVTAAIVLYLIGRIGPSLSFEEIAGKIVAEAGIVAIGFSVGTAQLGSGGGEIERTIGLGSNVTIAACGAALFAANVAPTQEIVVIGVEASPARILGIAILSMALAALALYFSDFKNSSVVSPVESPADIVMGTLLTYAIALLVSGVSLWFFGRFDGVSWDIALRLTVVLGFPAALGASAGRLLLQK